jgi:5-methyltetrahydrofolate--homocysteine methyltransferase
VAGLLKAACALPLWIKANAGLPQVDASGKTTFPMGPRAFAASAKALREAGANFIGGCCGTTPEHIAALRGCLE